MPEKATFQCNFEYKFENWSQTFSASPEYLFEPKNEDDIRTVLKLAHENEKVVKVIGGGLSPSDIACCDDYLVSLKHMNKVLDVDVESLTITVQAGITIAELNDSVLPQNGLAFSNQGSVAGQTVGGIIATGTHGTGKEYGSFASSVLELTMITANGNLMHLSKDSNPEQFSAAKCHLGLLGIITSAKIQVEEAFSVKVQHAPDTFSHMIENIPKFIESSQHSKIHWFPHTNDVVKTTCDRTTAANKKEGSYIYDVLIGYYFLEFCLWIASFIPWLIPTINKLFFKLCHFRKCVSVVRSDHGFNMECLFKQYVTEWAIPQNKTEHVLRSMKDWLLKNPDVMVDFPVEIRFVHSDGIMMSPSGDCDVTYIGIISYRPYGKSVNHDKWWNFYENLAKSVGGKPHWAKAHKETQEYLKTVYQNFNTFMDIRKKLDPTGVFLNKYWKRVLCI